VSEANNTPAGGESKPAAPAAPAVDEIKNLKAEYSRKMSNLEEQLKKTNELLQARIAPKAPSVEKEKIADVWYSDPEKAAALIQEQTAAQLEAKLAAQQAQQAKYSQTINQLYNEYPELQQEEGTLTKRAAEIYKGLTDEERAHPLAMRMAVKDAASELGIKPRSKRGEDDDSFALGGGRGGEGRKKKDRDGDLDPATLGFAKVMGLNVSDPKVLERLKARSKRGWGKYE